MKTCTLIWLFCSYCSLALAQSRAPIDVRIQHLYSGAMRDVYNQETQSKDANLYWREQWSRGIIKLKNGGEVEEFPIRFNIKRQGLEVFLGRETQFLAAEQIAEFFIEADGQGLHHFINPAIYFEDKSLAVGIFEVLVQGPWTLLRKSELKKWQATGLYTDSSQQTEERKDSFYLYYQKNLLQIPPQKKKAINVLRPYLPDIETRVKKAKINFRHAASLQLWVIDLNEKVKNPIKGTN